jgi:hypothetical protein
MVLGVWLTCLFPTPFHNAVNLNGVASRRVAPQEFEDPGLLFHAFEGRQDRGIFDRTVKIKEENVASRIIAVGDGFDLCQVISMSANSRRISKSAPAL